jgi:hypothetical protein
MEQELTELEVMSFIQEAVNNPKNNELRVQIIDPIIEVLEKPAGRKQYIAYGSSFLGDNAEMLSQEYPTKAVSFPRRYVDEVLLMFGFTVESLKKILKELLKQVNDKANFHTLLSSPTNFVHAIVLFYADMILNRQLRDSARQQIGLSIYANIYLKYFKAGFLNESLMAYTYMNLSGSWGIVKAENMINWIGDTVETSYGFYKTKLSVNMSMNVLVQFLNRLRSSFNQNMQLLANKYNENMDKGNLVGEDIDGSEEYLETNSYANIRDNLMRLIKSGDELYKYKGELYPAIARMKNVKTETLFDFSTKTVDIKDTKLIMDTILYVFLVKEGNKIGDINSTKYISRITNFPTAVDRAIQGKPIILPLSKKYKVDSSIVKAYICLIATYILYRINDINQ